MASRNHKSSVFQPIFLYHSKTHGFCNFFLFFANPHPNLMKIISNSQKSSIGTVTNASSNLGKKHQIMMENPENHVQYHSFESLTMLITLPVSRKIPSPVVFVPPDQILWLCTVIFFPPGMNITTGAMIFLPLS